MDSSIKTDRKRKIDKLHSNDSQLSSVTTSPTEALSAPPDNGGLCGRCSGINLDEIFKRKIENSESSFVMNLGSIVALKASHCRLGLYHLRAFRADWVFTGMEREFFQDTNVLAVAPSKSTPKRLPFGKNWDMRDILRETGYLSQESLINTQSVWKVRRLEPRVFDFTLLSTWMSYCDENHRTRCSRKTFSELRRFYVFDCRSREVVDAPDGCRYVALSYVWGKNDSSGSSVGPASPQNKRDRLEKVIEDSITVTQSLGLHYLWADRICIDQSDDEDKRHQISQMDIIYANSTLTIIAAAGNGPDHGLPGINGTPRSIQQRKFVFGNRSLISTLPAGSYTVQKSKWHTRGWTFQEGILSIRRLIFTEAQVLFECNGMHCSERKFDILAYNMGAFSAKTPGSDPAEYMRYVASYSSRQLTYREDALNAFQGVLNSFKRAKNPDNGKNWSSLDEIDFQPRMFALQDVYSSIIQIEGWTIVVGIVDLHFNAEEKACFAKEEMFSPRDGIHLSFGMGSRGTVYSRLECHDMSWVYSPNHTFIGFLPSAYTENQGSMFEYAMLLENVGGCYERVGLFRPRYCWDWDEEGKLQKISGDLSGQGCDALESSKRRFWLG
ncbi:Heterokaryon incompatibility protein (HET) domain containing protein [Rhypophila decipiens]